MSQGNKFNIVLLIVITLLLLVLVAGGAWGYWHFVMNKSATEKPQEVATAAAVVKKPIFINLDRFVVSVQGEERLRYMMLELSLMTYNGQFEAQVQEFMPLVRNSIVTELSHENFAKLTAPNAMTALQEKLLTAVRTTMQKSAGDSAVDQVLITKLVVQ
ncbi:MAG: flagellar basal body-associated FliL family protein [Plesiomonas sp.]|uniref:flagellar basal body-associated FliL family protein n=1 Tax=Plesiomonas sp. TaxID=2486279 RepID=UPI003F351CA7